MAVDWGRLARVLSRVAAQQAPRALRELQRQAPAVRRRARRSGSAARPPVRVRPVDPAALPQPAGGPDERLLDYAPQLDGRADPGEVVWGWVPYEEDPSRGKDRPVLVVGRRGRTLLGLLLSSQAERDDDPAWLALGPGAWDREARPSWVRLDRVLEVEEDGIRREGAVLDRARFDRVAGALRRDHGWP